MEERFPCKPYEVSEVFNESLANVFEYGLETFGLLQADRYLQGIEEAVDSLPYSYGSNPYCRHIQIPGEVYRNIIIGSHLIIYRV
ncbi:MAG: type II toxin-antitoxin system RelE/ParE family toxin, partial [Dysgonamonadaceae bacterium]|nr:type II toxin-antitoxin system RelE/ParE family toxin [Dysgonamonadaceae bacterium]